MLAACPVQPGRNGEPVNFALRPYQREAIAATIKGFDEFRRQLIVCPTGGGKALLFAKIAVIDRIMQRRAAGLATYKQVRTLRKFGVPDPHLISFKRAGAILDRLFSGRFSRETA